jgi:hypothetical protein
VRKNIYMLLIVVMFQAGVYLYLDQVLLVPSAKFSQRSVTYGLKAAVDPQKISTDQKYYAVVQATSVNFFTADNGLVKELPLQAGENVSYFSWVPDTHLALIGVASDSSKGSTVTLKPVNLDTNSSPEEPKISNLSPGSTIHGVAYSPLVNVSYLLIKGKSTSLVYRTDANNRLTKVFSTNTIQRIATLQSVDMLLYDNTKDGSIYSRSTFGNQKMISPKQGKYALIGADKDDNIYIGKLTSTGLVSAVLKGTIKGDFTEFQTLATPSPAASIAISYYGKLQID